MKHTIASPLVRGFTLVEIMVVLSIITVILAIVLPSLTAVRANSRIKAETTSVGEIKLQLALYRDLHKTFPPGVSGSLLDGCTTCLLRPGASYDLTLATSQWQSIAAQLSGVSGGVTKIADVWGNPYAYDNNYRVANLARYSGVCSMGPDGILQTLDAPFLVETIPQVLGDDICHFFQ
jgi:prepilin-type N-terminal cleavage/methylation domain-containing protein